MRWTPLFRPIGTALSALWWLAFPIVPMLVEDAYASLAAPDQFTSRYGPDPHVWDASRWAIMLGPLCGFGFLAGSTWKIGGEAGWSGWRSWKSRRSVWVGLGPWLGFVTFMAVALSFFAVCWALDQMGIMPDGNMPQWLRNPVIVILITWLALGWLIVAGASLRRAKRMGQFQAAMGRGLSLAIVFVGSLFGGYWIVTTLWKDHYFDPTIVP